MKAAVGALALCDLPGMAAAGGRSLLQDAAGPSLGSPLPEGAGPSVAPPAPGLTFKNPLIVANVTILPPPPPAAPPPPPVMGPPPLNNAVMDGTGLAIPPTNSVSDYNVANRASLTYLPAVSPFLHDSQSFAARACLLSDKQVALQTPPLGSGDYVYPAFPPDGFSFQAIDHEIDIVWGGMYRKPDYTMFRSSYYVGSSGLDATLMALSMPPNQEDVQQYFQPIGSDVPDDVSYVKYRMCGPNGQEWTGIDTRLPLDSNGVSYLSLVAPGQAGGRLGAWPALRQKAFSKFLLEHPELSNDPTRPGLQNIVGNNPYHAISALACNTPDVINPHTPVGFGQTPVFGPLRQAVTGLLNNNQRFVLMTTISDQIFTRDGTYDESNDSVTYTYGANLRRSPINNFGQVLTYTAPNGGSTVIVPSHCYLVEMQDASQGLFKLTSPWGFSFTTNTAITGETGPRSLTVTADLLWSVGDQIFSAYE